MCGSNKVSTRDISAPAGRVLALGSDTCAFLSVVRSLGRRGIAVEIGWCPPESPTRRSRYISAIHDLPMPGGDGATWLEPFVELIRARPFDLVIPCDDPTSLPIHVHRDQLEPHARFYLLPADTYETTASKHRTHELARRLGIPLPHEELVETRSELERAALRIGYPLVIKPDRSFTAQNLGHRNTHAKIRSREDLARARIALPAIVAEHVDGQGVGVSVLAAEGATLVAFQHRREHEPPIGGGSAYRSSVPLDPQLLAAAAELMKALDYTGVAMVEFKVDPRTGRWFLMEINGRFWGSLPLALAAGVDFPYYLYDLLVNGRRVFPSDYQAGIYARNTSLDFTWTLENLRADRKDPILLTRPMRQVVRDALRLLTLHEHNDTLTLDDPLPGLAEIWAIIRTVVRHRREALSRHVQIPR
jgi:predicted ATP-grasp superfamily ATP-dependent carboligase